MSRRVILAVTLGLIALFWFNLTKNNFFHWDEWSFLLGFNQSPLNFLTKSYGEHYIPLNLLNHYVLFSIFGLNNLPFQLSVLAFHTFNCLLLYKIIMKKTGNFLLSILGTLLFGISNTYVEDVIWSQGISNVASATFVFLAYYLYLLNPKRLKFILLSAFSLLISPLFNDLGVLMPFAFVTMELVTSKSLKKLNWQVICAYFAAALINLLIIFFFSKTAISHTTKFSFDLLYKLPEFILYGILRGAIIRFFYPGFHFVAGHQETKTILVSFVSLVALVGATLLMGHWLGDRKTRITRIKNLLVFAIMIFVGYFTVALGRTSYGLAQAGISRYAYQPFFFVILSGAYIFKDYGTKLKLITVVSLFLLLINIISVIRFETEFWSVMVGRDRQFIEDASYLLRNNFVVCDTPVPGIFPQIKLSNLWFLKQENLFLTSDCDKALKDIAIDEKSKEIYSRIKGPYQQKFD